MAVHELSVVCQMITEMLSLQKEENGWCMTSSNLHRLQRWDGLEQGSPTTQSMDYYRSLAHWKLGRISGGQMRKATFAQAQGMCTKPSLCHCRSAESESLGTAGLSSATG